MKQSKTRMSPVVGVPGVCSQLGRVVTGLISPVFARAWASA